MSRLLQRTRRRHSESLVSDDLPQLLEIVLHTLGFAQLRKDIDHLKKASGCGVVFQPMKEPTVPGGFHEDLYGFDIVTDDAVGIIAELTGLVAEFGMMVVGHTGERRVIPGPTPKVQGGQKYVVMLPFEFDHIGFTNALTALVKKYSGIMKTPLRTVPGLLWWW